ENTVLKNLLFITTANLSTNPRLYKEIRLAESLGYKVAFVAFHQGGWSDEKDKVLRKDIKATGHYLSALRKPFWSWFIGTLLNRVCRRVCPFVKHNLWVAAMAHNKRTYHLLNFMPK